MEIVGTFRIIPSVRVLSTKQKYASNSRTILAHLTFAKIIIRTCARERMESVRRLIMFLIIRMNTR